MNLVGFLGSSKDVLNAIECEFVAHTSAVQWQFTALQLLCRTRLSEGNGAVHDISAPAAHPARVLAGIKWKEGIYCRSTSSSMRLSILRYRAITLFLRNSCANWSSP